MRSRLTRVTRGGLLVLTLGLAPGWTAAQEVQEGQAVTTPRPIELHDILGWKRIGGATLSDDGGWMAYRLNPQEGDGEVVVRSTSDTTEFRFPSGEGSGALGFSSDSRWLAFIINPGREEARRARTQRRTLNDKVGLVELSTGEMTEHENVRSFAFAGERGGWIALNKAPAAAPGGGKIRSVKK